MTRAAVTINITKAVEQFDDLPPFTHARIVGLVLSATPSSPVKVIDGDLTIAAGSLPGLVFIPVDGEVSNRRHHAIEIKHVAAPLPYVLTILLEKSV